MLATITLTEAEFAAACTIGEKRQAYRVRKGHDKTPYADSGGTFNERQHVGAVCEYALAKSLGPEILRDWCENKAYVDANPHLILSDVGRNLHVRGTTKPHGGVILHPKDPSNGIFVLARLDVQTRTVTFVGWNVAGALKVAKYWRNSGPGFGQPGRAAFCAPESALFDMSTLPQEAI